MLDLKAADFAIEEDGVPQKVESFEHIVVRPAGPQSERVEPSSQREMLQAAENPRNRVFVIFLDQTHVPFEASHAITEPLIRLINRILEPGRSGRDHDARHERVGDRAGAAHRGHRGAAAHALATGAIASRR